MAGLTDTESGLVNKGLNAAFSNDGFDVRKAGLGRGMSELQISFHEQHADSNGKPPVAKVAELLEGAGIYHAKINAQGMKVMIR
ncbi:MAG: hypothetical protein H6868_09135 [Rhodospirillales bacterium]|nr:hypothetical protein [Rhodospirillales bacterium]